MFILFPAVVVADPLATACGIPRATWKRDVLVLTPVEHHFEALFGEIII